MANPNPYRRQVLNLDTGEKYPSIRHLAQEMGVNMGHLTTAIAKGHRCHGAKFQYLDPPRPDPNAEGAAHEVQVLEALGQGPLSLSQVAQLTGLDSKLALGALNRQRGICVRRLSNDEGIFWELQTPPNNEDCETFNSHGRRSAPVDHIRRLGQYTAQMLGAKSVSFLGGELVAMYPAKSLDELEVGRYATISKYGEPAYTGKTSCITSINRDTGGDWVSVTTRAAGKKKFLVRPGELEAVGRPVPLSLDLGEELRAALPRIRKVVYKASLGRAKQGQLICEATGIDDSLIWLLEPFWYHGIQGDRQALDKWISKQADWAGLNFCQRHRLASGKFLRLRPCLPITYHPNFPGLK